MSQSEPDVTLMPAFCRDQLPLLLHDACGVDDDLARAIGEDVLTRAEAFAALGYEAQEILTAPFVEEVFEYEPRDASVTLKASVTVVVRNSLLEEAHAYGSVNAGGLEVITTRAAGVLSHFIAARQRRPRQLTDDEQLFGELAERYPRAWACFSTLAQALDDGGRTPFRAPQAPVPELPDAAEHAEAKLTDEGHAIFSAIDPRFDQKLIEMLEQVVAHHIPLFVPTLSRLSRNQEKLHRIVEYLLAHDTAILTTNYLLRSSDVWVRRLPLIQPDNWNGTAVLEDLRGLSGTHRAVASQIHKALA